MMQKPVGRNSVAAARVRLTADRLQAETPAGDLGRRVCRSPRP